MVRPQEKTLALLALASLAAACPDGWTLGSTESCYMITETLHTYDECAAQCSPGVPACIDNAGENEELTHVVIS